MYTIQSAQFMLYELRIKLTPTHFKNLHFKGRSPKLSPTKLQRLGNPAGKNDNLNAFFDGKNQDNLRFDLTAQFSILSTFLSTNRLVSVINSRGFF
jgi:hypothetical protein